MRLPVQSVSWEPSLAHGVLLAKFNDPVDYIFFNSENFSRSVHKSIHLHKAAAVKKAISYYIWNIVFAAETKNAVLSIEFHTRLPAVDFETNQILISARISLVKKRTRKRELC